MCLKLFAYWETLKYTLRNEKGQGMVEYGLILVAVSIAAIVALQLIGTNLSSMFNTAAGKIVAPK